MRKHRRLHTTCDREYLNRVGSQARAWGGGSAWRSCGGLLFWGGGLVSFGWSTVLNPIAQAVLRFFQRFCPWGVPLNLHCLANRRPSSFQPTSSTSHTRRIPREPPEPPPRHVRRRRRFGGCARPISTSPRCDRSSKRWSTSASSASRPERRRRAF